jgi:hypothetical protein
MLLSCVAAIFFVYFMCPEVSKPNIPTTSELSFLFFFC